MGARGVKLALRKQALTLHHALRWRGQHLFLTAISPRGRGHLDVTAALVQPETVRLVPDGGDRGMAFPGVLTPHELDEFKNEYEIGRRAEL